ncbi:MAG: sugar (Glycoside-Pentoside-Hexuronide) transporter, partial [Acidobacteria bacterium]|nr:sugar (Glycoside-Pentoside-Hexuronide) transporter [Acidobacteriota bacterium]
MERLPKRILYTYGVSELCFSLMVGMEVYFFSAFLTDYAQFPLKLAGQILLLTSLFDIVCALGGAVILQKVTMPFGGKYRSWLLVGPPVVAPLFVMQFVKIGSDSMAAAVIIFAFVSSHMLWNVSYAAVGSMLGRLSQLPDERTTMSASRTQGGCVAGLIFSLAGLPMINFFGERTSRLAGFPITTAIFALLMICGYLYIYKITAGKDPYDEASAGSTGKGSQESMKEVAGLALRNRPLLFIITADTFNNTATFMNLAFSFYYFIY